MISPNSTRSHSWAHCPRMTMAKIRLAVLVGKLTQLPRSKCVNVFQDLWNSRPVCATQMLRPICRMRAHFLQPKDQTWRVTLPVLIILTERIQNATRVPKEHRMESVTETKLVAMIQNIHINAWPRKETHRPLPTIHSPGMHRQTERNPRLTVHLNSQGKVFGMTVALTSSNWCSGKPNLFLIAKPNGLCMGSAMLVRTCSFYSPLPFCEHETRLANTVRRATFKTRSLAGIFKGGGVSICQRCHSKWVYLPICYHLLIMDLGDNCHKSCRKTCNKVRVLGAGGDVCRRTEWES